MDFLIDNDLPVHVLRVSIYEDQQGPRFVDVEGEHEPELASEGGDGAGLTRVHTKIDGRRVRMTDLLDAGLRHPGDQLVWERPRLGQTYRAEVIENGSIKPDGHEAFASPSRAGPGGGRHRLV